VRISPPHIKSRHVIIVIAGFRQEDQEPLEFWKHLVSYYKHAEIFCLRWTSGTAVAFHIPGYFKGNEKNIKKSNSGLFDVYNTGRRQFYFAVNQAVLTGTMLAHYLAKSEFSKNRAVSITGFSLGGAVTFNCLKMMKRISDHIEPSASAILHDVYVWAGAYVIDHTGMDEEIVEKSEACTVINGNLNNCYSLKDGALKGFKSQLYPGKVPVGFKPIFDNIPEKDQDRCKLAKNYNLTEECPGHVVYATNCGSWLYKVDDSY
jgi:hypothetical protein